MRDVVMTAEEIPQMYRDFLFFFAEFMNVRGENVP